MSFLTKSDIIRPECPICGRKIIPAELTLYPDPCGGYSRLKIECYTCRITFTIEAIDLPYEPRKDSVAPAINAWNKLPRPGKPRPAALDKIRTRYEAANGVDKAILREVLEILEV